MSKPRKKPVTGHKCKGVSVGYRSNCECGWSSPNFYGKGARASAYAEWHYHVDQCHKAAETAKVDR